MSLQDTNKDQLSENKDIHQLSVNNLRMLSIDQVEAANSGHPGLPMGAAPMAYVVWSGFLKHNPGNPHWFDRDRFVLSAGHGSALLYSLLHLSGYDLSIEELKNFRKWGSKTPGHPEYPHTAGVEATTGPLGQGIGNAVGMAMAERHLAATYNKDGDEIINHYTYALCGDGDLMEGVSAEAASMAGHWGLGKLIVLYDSNDISLDGKLSESFTERTGDRFKAYGWQYILVEDGNNLDAIEAAIKEAQGDKVHPTLIEIKTTIGFGSPNKGGTHKVHGAPLGAEEVELVKKAYGWTQETFAVLDEVKAHFNKIKEAGAEAEQRWKEKLAHYKEKHGDLGTLLQHAIDGTLPEGWDRDLPVYSVNDKAIATRAASGNAINALAKNLPSLFGGSADLASSNNTNIKGEGVFHAKDYSGRNIWFGVREHAMGAALNGLAYHGGVKPYGATFLVFSDYLRPSIRLAALSKLPVVYVFTHDSIAVGEDGPTHEPVEHLPSLRSLPGLNVLRPGDANETTEAWRFAMTSEAPTALLLTRQNLPILKDSDKLAKEYVSKGAYVLSEPEGEVHAVLLASGSEVSLAVEAQEKLKAGGINARVVSMPSWELFEKQPKEYRDSVILPQVKARVGIEMAIPLGWERYVGDGGAVIGVNGFGASGPGGRVMEEYGFTADNVVSTVKKLIG